MPSAWVGKPCARCGGRKGDKYRTNKYCGRCVHAIARQASANAHAKALERRYGITREDYWNLYQYQGGVCYICQRATGKTRRLTVDHDLGQFRDDPEAAQRVIDYLGAPPFARMMGAKYRGNAPGAQDGGHRGNSSEG
jgi:hypothetical protein